MITKFEQALAALRKLPEDRQDELAEALTLAAQMPVKSYTDAENVAIDEGVADADAGRFITDDELQATFARFRIV